MMPNSPWDNLRQVFGPLSQELPAPPVTFDQPLPAPEEEEPADDLPNMPVMSEKTGLVLVPAFRVDGDDVSPPWNQPEPALWQALSLVDVEHVEERVFGGANGVFWARVRFPEGDEALSPSVSVKSALLKLAGGEKDWLFDLWGEEYQLEPGGADLLNRELAAYEVAKACGMEDLVPPMAAKEVDIVSLLSDAAREKIASVLRISLLLVDETLGTSAIVQLYPKDSDNFVETWAALGASEKDRWAASTDRLRHSIYRAFALDFILGVQDRSLASYLYNKITDRIAIIDLAPAFPHPGLVAERYLKTRAEGWGREIKAGLTRSLRPWPAHSCDIARLVEDLESRNRHELLQTVQQVSRSLTPDVLTHLARVLISYNVPMPCVAGALARAVYAGLSSESLIDKPFDFVRNVAVPLRRGMGLDEHVLRTLIDSVAEPLSAAFDEQVDLVIAFQDSGEPSE